MIDYSAIVNRTIEMMVNPKKTWRVIRDEPQRGRELITRYVLLLALVPTVCSFLGHLAYSEGFFFSLIFSVLMLGVYLGSLFILGLIVNAMAPSFGTVRNENAAYKLMVYSSTPLWVAGILTLFPSITVVAALAGFGYALYLFYLGCQVLMDTPNEKALPFSFASIGAWFGVVLLTALVVSQIAGLVFAPSIILSKFAQVPGPLKH